MFSTSRNLVKRNIFGNGNSLKLNALRNCCDFIIAGGSGSNKYAITSRTMEFGDMFVTENMTVQQKGKKFNYGGLEKTNDYGYLMINGTLETDEYGGVEASVDGFNEHGLSCDLLFYPRSIGWPKKNELTPQNNICADMFLPFILGNCKTLQDVRHALENDYDVWGEDIHNKYWTGHFQICDADGNGLVVEYVKVNDEVPGEQHIYDSVGVMTNEPPYPYHLQNIHQYCHLTNFVSRQVQSEQLGHGAGLIGLPGDLTPPSRFIRCYLAKKFLDKENIIQNNDDAIIESAHIINSVDIVRGMAKGYISAEDEIGELDYTQWSVMKDLINKKIYFREYDSLTWNTYDFGTTLNQLPTGESTKLANFETEPKIKVRNMLKMN